MTRYQYIDRLKGLAIILVVIGHLMLSYDSKNDVTTFIGSFHMPLFIFLSGIVVSRPPAIKKTLQKLRGILSPYFIVGGGGLLLFNEDIRQLVLTEYDHGYWYLRTLAYLYITLMPLSYIYREGGVSFCL